MLQNKLGTHDISPLSIPLLSMRLLSFMGLFVEILFRRWMWMNYFFLFSSKQWRWCVFFSPLCPLPRCVALTLSKNSTQLIVIIKWNQCLLPKEKCISWVKIKKSIRSCWNKNVQCSVCMFVYGTAGNFTNKNKSNGEKANSKP